jgi:hypothetical protein
MRFAITIQGTTNETAITKIPHPSQSPSENKAALKSMAETWFEQDEPRWFERSDVFHGSGILLDKKTKVVVTSDGKKLDSFKLADVPELFKVTQATGNSCDMSSAGILAMENSEGTATFTGSVDAYDRAKLLFEVARIGGFNLFAAEPAAGSAQYFIITGVAGFTSEGIDSGKTSSAILISSGLPFSAPAECKYDPAAAARFRKTFLG